MKIPAATQVAHDISDANQVGAARRAAAELASAAGLGGDARANLSVVVNELAGNLVKHAKGGVIFVAIAGPGVVEVITVDRGPGMANVERCLADGFSTSGTLGHGLGAVRRLAGDFDVWSGPTGSAVVARIADTAALARRGRPRGICVPIHGETACGDAWAVREDASGCSILAVDGLGHGPDAAVVAQAAVKLFDSRDVSLDAKATLDHIDQVLRGTRGAAVSLATIASGGAILRYCGVGNISARLDTELVSRGLVSSNGIVGGQFRRPQVFDYPYADGTLLILHSDGLQSRWDLNNYAGLRHRDPALIAAVLWRDYSRGRDDATIVVTRLKAGAGK